MSDPRLPRHPGLPRTATMTDRPVLRPMALRAGRDPARPYVDTVASLASLAKHIKLGLDRSRPDTAIPTATLELLLDHVIALGFGAAAVERYQQGAEWQAELAQAHQAASEAQVAAATREDESNG